MASWVLVALFGLARASRGQVEMGGKPTWWGKSRKDNQRVEASELSALEGAGEAGPVRPTADGLLS